MPKITNSAAAELLRNVERPVWAANGSDPIEFFARQLEHIESKTYLAQYPDLSAFKTFSDGKPLFPMNEATGEGLTAVTWRRYDYTGKATVHGELSTDVPRINLTAEEKTVRIKTFTDFYEITDKEAAGAAYANVPLDTTKGMFARRSIEAEVNRIIFAGEPTGTENGATGILTIGNGIPVSTAAATGTGGATAWISKTPEQIFDDILAKIAEQATLTNGAERFDTMLVDPATYLTLLRPINIAANETVLSFILDKCKVITTIDQAPELAKNNASTNPYAVGAAPQNVALFLTRSNADKISMVLPTPFTIKPPLPQPYSIKYFCKEETGGLAIHYPKSAGILVGV